MTMRIIIKRLIAIVLVMTIGMTAIPINAHDRQQHDFDLESVLFGKENFTTSQKPEVKNAAKALKCAAYLAIDQFNGNGAEDLNFLKNEYNVSGLPKLSEIDFKGNNNHRRYTHRGWDFPYGNSDVGHWAERKRILLQTVDKEFDFEKSPNAVLGHFNKKYLEYDKKCDSFCALIYYTHILGDYIGNKTYVQFRSNYPNQIELGGTNDEYSITAELLKYTERLFTDQKNTHKYITLKNSLTTLDVKIRKIVQSNGGINTEEEYRQYTKYAEDLKDILTHNIPNLLKEEEFFKKVYYS